MTYDPPMFLILLVQVKDSLEETPCLLHGEIAVPIDVVGVEELLNVLHALSNISLLHGLQSMFVIVENDGEQDTCEKKDAYKDKYDEEKTISCVGDCDLEHDIRKILGR